MMIDMSKAFDTVNWKTLLKKFEIRMMYLHTNNVKLKMRVERSSGEEILTNIGVAQGDCLSALLFIFYLAKFVDVITWLTNKERFW